MRSLQDIAERALFMYNPNEQYAQPKYQLFAEYAFRELVHEVGGVYQRTVTLPLVAGQQVYALPEDFLEIISVAKVDGAGEDTTPLAFSDVAMLCQPGHVVTGEPDQFFFTPTAGQIAIYPAPVEGSEGALILTYDADAPGDLNAQATLPLGNHVEEGVIAGIHLRAAQMPPQDQVMISVATQKWKATLQRCKADATRNRQVRVTQPDFWRTELI